MELLEIKGIFEMDCGSPSPIIISNDNELIIAFYADKESSLSLSIPTERNMVHDTGIFALKFKRYLKYKFGLPGNETIQWHPYTKLGMKSFSFYELKDSNFIRELEDIEKKHPYYNSQKWNLYKHYILTFHDNMFECIAQDFEIRQENISLHNKIALILNELSVKNS